MNYEKIDLIRSLFDSIMLKKKQTYYPDNKNELTDLEACDGNSLSH